ncbi:MAG TPA: 4'-phosphopantetheinyl transferase superfamily protein [Streptosporangiaceae bacterium]|nr:4'-phosphopantetheinyl transferase superfamily protein [Streptosporangiaceae bacterium]
MLEVFVLLGTLLPDTASVAEAFGDQAPEDPAPGDGLFPEEEAMVARAVQRRRQEFATGRRCARQALAALGFPARPLLTGPNREPLWPAGVVGSITHCDGYRAAAVAHVRDLASVGIDAEPNKPLPDGVLGVVALPGEVDQLAALTDADPTVCWDRLLFSAKESIYKTWFPLARRWLGFTDAKVEVDRVEAAFTATLLVPGPPYGEGILRTLRGRFVAENGLIVTAIALPVTSAVTS